MLCVAIKLFRWVQYAGYLVERRFLHPIGHARQNVLDIMFQIPPEGVALFTLMLSTLAV